MKLKFGKFKGLDLEDIMNEEDGPQYLDWLRENTETTGKYAKQNRQLIAEIEEVIGKGSEPAPRSATARPQAAPPPPSGAATDLLKQIAATLQRIEKILANPKQTHIAESEMAPDENLF